jgi:hypothetical protein
MYAKRTFQKMVYTFADIDIKSRIAKLQLDFIYHTNGSFGVFLTVARLYTTQTTTLHDTMLQPRTN